MKKAVLIIALAVVITLLSLVIYRPDRSTGIVCVKSPCHSVMPAGRGFPFVFLYEKDDFVHYVSYSVLVLGKFNLVGFGGNLIAISLILVVLYFAYSKLFKKAGKKK